MVRQFRWRASWGKVGQSVSDHRLAGQERRRRRRKGAAGAASEKKKRQRNWPLVHAIGI